MKAHRQVKKFFYLSFVLPYFVIAQLPLTLERANRAYLYYLEGNEAAASAYWEEAYLKLKKSVTIDSTDILAMFCHQLLEDILDHRIEQNTGLYLFRTLHALDFHEKNEAKEQLANINMEIKDYPPYYLIHGMLEDAFNQKSAAIISYNKTLAIDPQNVLALYKRAKDYYHTGEVQKALTDLTLASELLPTGDDIFFERGRIFQSRKMYEEAIADYEKAYDLNHTLKQILGKSLLVCEAYNHRGSIHMQRQEFEQALLDFNQAIAWNDQFPEPFLNRGTVYREMQLLAAASQDIERAIILDSTDAEAYFQKGLLSIQEGNQEKAEKNWLKAALFDSQKVKICLALGEMYYGQHKYNEVISILQKGLKGSPDNCWIHYWLALAWDGKRHYKEAIVHYEAFVRLAPEEYFDHRLKMWERAERLKKWLNRNH